VTNISHLSFLSRLMTEPRTLTVREAGSIEIGNRLHGGLEVSQARRKTQPHHLPHASTRKLALAASSCTHRWTVGDDECRRGVGELQIGRNSCAGLMLRSTTIPSIGLARARFWSTDSLPPP